MTSRNKIKIKLLKFLGLISLSGGFLALSACANDCIQMPYAPGVSNSGLFASNNNLEKISTKRGVLTINSPGSDLVSGNIIRGKAVVVNNSGKDQKAQYQFQWMDQKGFPAGDNTPWQPVLISAHSSQVISDVAPNSSVNAYVIKVCR